uniref:RNA exonuclease 4 n=1 Tax=Spongospora subterranea TaxID=70186 RepID=A0A0H5QFQ8_9EUKA|eukprot:CRZ00883.1 hypothetical protein [Spongospora subterranea]
MAKTTLGSNWAKVHKTIKKSNKIGKPKQALDKNSSVPDVAQEQRPSVPSEPLCQLIMQSKNLATSEEKLNPLLTNIIAIDCEMVGVGPSGKRHALARVSIVNFHGDVLLDTLVKPTEPITDHRTQFSGISRGGLLSAPSFKDVQQQVADIIKDRIVVGHSVQTDFRCLMLSHPRNLIRDTTNKLLCPLAPKSLKNLCMEHLQLPIQEGQHNSIEDARATLALYKHFSTQWEKRVALTHRNRKKLKKR